MRIGFDAKRAFNNHTGLGNYSRFVIRALVQLYPQHEYFLFTPKIEEQFKRFVEGSNVHIVTPQTFLGKTFQSAWRRLSLTDEINAYNLDVFHGLSNELPIGIEKFTGKKIVTTHDLIFLRYPDYYNNIDRYIYTRKFKHACEKADIIIAASEQTRQDIIRYFGTDEQKIKVVYQNCDDSFSLRIADTVKQQIKDTYNLPEQYILSVGTIEQRKNQLTILKAFHQLNNPKYKLVFVGKQTDYAQQLHQYIQQHQLANNVLFLDNVKFAHFPAVYQMAALFVYASEFEGFGIPVLEGMRSRVPVIAANTSSLTEVGGEAVKYFQFNDVASLGETMNLVLTSAIVQQQMIEAGVKQAEKFDAKGIMEELVRCY